MICNALISACGGGVCVCCKPIEGQPSAFVGAAAYQALSSEQMKEELQKGESCGLCLAQAGVVAVLRSCCRS